MTMAHDPRHVCNPQGGPVVAVMVSLPRIPALINLVLISQTSQVSQVVQLSWLFAPSFN